MSGFLTSIHITNLLGLLGFLLLWITGVKFTRLLVTFLRNDPLIGWAIGPLGLTTLFLREPSAVSILLDALCPAIVSGAILYLGLFSPLPGPINIPRQPLIEIFVIAGGVLLTSASDFINALFDLRYPLWGEARILRSIQMLRASWASIHFTSFGLSYLRDRFGATPTDLLQAF